MQILDLLRKMSMPMKILKMPGKLGHHAMHFSGKPLKSCKLPRSRPSYKAKSAKALSNSPKPMKSRKYGHQQILEVHANSAHFQEISCKLQGDLAIMLCTSERKSDESPKVHENPVIGNCSLASMQCNPGRSRALAAKCQDMFPIREGQCFHSLLNFQGSYHFLERSAAYPKF